MRGRINRQTNLFVKINLEDLVPADHPAGGPTIADGEVGKWPDKSAL